MADMDKVMDILHRIALDTRASSLSSAAASAIETRSLKELIETGATACIVEPVVAPYPVPSVRLSRLDGYAVKSSSGTGVHTVRASNYPGAVVATVAASSSSGNEPSNTHISSATEKIAVWVTTGGQIPEEMDVVVPVDYH